MISSMTGYGRAQQLIDGRDICVEIRSVNHRFFEFSARLPRAFGYLEEKLKGLVRASVSRGKVDVNVTVVTVDDLGAGVEVNRQLARGYLGALRSLGAELGVVDDLKLSDLAHFHDLFVLRKDPDEEDAVWNGVRAVAEQALDKYLSMRATEGAMLVQDIRSRIELIARHVGAIERLAPKAVEEYRARLYAKLCEVLEDRQADEQRVLTEAAVFAEKIAVDEETVRLRSHLEQLGSILQGGPPVGRKLDFLVQELNREANTIGSKAQDIEIARLVVDMKSEIEKIREQVQNVE